MYIKQIIIQGFKSYKDQTVIEPFSPKHNVIVGRNGSGKSNFFAAVRFVLSDKYTQLSREDRQSLLHEGAGSAVMSAYVELIIDNTDERIPTNTPEVILRRTIGQKKDEYSLNRKNTTKNEVLNILESAGFSRSNPYYIVPQGRVTAITNMKDNERLNMLKTVAGTEVYESRRAESHKIMQDTELKRNKIDDLLNHIHGRLSELEEEKEELRAFQERERERKCLEYSIHKKDEESISEQLERIEESVGGRSEQNDDNREALRNAEDQLEAMDTQITALQQQIKLFTQEKAQYKEERNEAARNKAKAESDFQAAQDNQNAAQQAQVQSASELKIVQSQIKQHEADLAKLLPEYRAKREQERTAKQQLLDAQAAVQRLYAKQGRPDQFRTKKERDIWLQQQIAETNQVLAKRKAIAMQIAEETTELESTIGQLEADIEELRERLTNRGADQQDIAAEVQQAQDEYIRLQDQRKELWREEAKLDSVTESARRQFEQMQDNLGQMMDYDTSRGLANVRRIVREESIEGAHGPLGELFKCQSSYKTAAEVTAGASLFHYVVDNEDIASDLVERLKKDRLGRITFVPLSRINIRATELPRASDAVPLLSRLKYEAKFEPAMQQVFGKTIVCPNLNVAAQYARSHELSAITPQGDRSDKKGALTGGYYDEKKSRLDSMAKLLAAREEFERVQGRKDEIRSEMQKLDQKVTKALSAKQRAEQKRSQLEGGYGPLREEMRSKERELINAREELEKKRGQKENIDRVLNDFSNQLASHQSELQADFKKALSNQDEQQLDSLNAQIPELRKSHDQLSRELAELDGQKRIIEDTLNVNLRPRLDQLQSLDLETSIAGDGNSTARLKELKANSKRATKGLENIEAKLRELEASIEEHQEELRSAEGQRATKASDVEKLEQAIRNHQKNIEKNASRRAQYVARLTEVRAQINSLGVLPEAAHTNKYMSMSTNTATQRLHKVQESLKKYGHVNKRAFEQFKQFEIQRSELNNRRKELDASDASIRELIDVLDQRKDEAIVRTFKQVSKEFSAVFERLVPAGKGRLIIQRRSDRQATNAARDEDDSDAEEEARSSAVENYIGVGISVSFNSKHDEQQRIQQLSGGQKSLCALALVFAIQFSDPAPFYLFDEIDANLDAQYRTAVAQLLQECSQTGQFICTTFRPEMLMVAEKCYGVSYLSKASSIDVVSREQALDFVEGQISGK